MRKNTLAIFVIGCLVTGSSFATPLDMKNMFMKDPIMKSRLVSKDHTQNSRSRFSGTWAGICTHDGENDEVKYRIEEDDIGLSMVDLRDQGNQGRKENFYYNEIKSEGHTDTDSYSTFTSRMSKINENTIKFEGTGVDANQPPITSKEKAMMISGVVTSMMTVNNNQLTIETNAKIFRGNSTKGSVDKCILKRAG